MSKTVSSRVENKLHKDMLQECNKLGVTMNEYIKEALRLLLYDKCDLEFEDEDSDEEPSEIEPDPLNRKRPEPKLTVSDIPETKEPQLEVIRL